MIDEFGIKRPDAIKIDLLIKQHSQEFIKKGKLIGKNGLAIGSGGNLSIKVQGGMLITSSGSLISDLTPEDIIYVSAVDKDNVFYYGTKKPSSEAPTHWIIYQARPDINAIVHVNAGPQDNKNVIVSKEEIPYGTLELGYDTGELLKKVDAVMMKDHGMMIVGKDFKSAVKLTIESADRKKPYIFAK